MNGARERPALKRYAVASMAAAVITIALKLAAYRVTSSVGLLSDALESLVNLAAAVAALAALSVAALPADSGGDARVPRLQADQRVDPPCSFP